MIIQKGQSFIQYPLTGNMGTVEAKEFRKFSLKRLKFRHFYGMVFTNHIYVTSHERPVYIYMI